MLVFSHGRKLFCITYEYHETLMVSGGAHMEEGHISFQLLLLGKLRVGTEAKYQSREESSLPSAWGLHLRKQRQAEPLQKALQYVQFWRGFWLSDAAGDGSGGGKGSTECRWICGACNLIIHTKHLKYLLFLSVNCK